MWKKLIMWAIKYLPVIVDAVEEAKAKDKK